MSMHRAVIALASVGVLLSFTAQASAQSCSTNSVPLQCNGTFTPSAATGTALLKVVAKDVSPINAGAQNVTAQVCDVGVLDDTFGLEVIRTGSPKDILRCVTTAGSGTGCSLTPVAKPANAASDTVFVVVQKLSGAVADGANFEVRATGWETLKVTREDTFFSTIALPAGTGCP
jgi:hypothetical protein